MKRRILSIALTTTAALALVAGPAAAHVNDNKPVNESADARQGGTPFSGFIGPVEEHIGSDAYVRAHSGMECGALRSPNITPLGPASVGPGEVPFDARFICPSA